MRTSVLAIICCMLLLSAAWPLCYGSAASSSPTLPILRSASSMAGAWTTVLCLLPSNPLGLRQSQQTDSLGTSSSIMQWSLLLGGWVLCFLAVPLVLFLRRLRHQWTTGEMRYGDKQTTMKMTGSVYFFFSSSLLLFFSSSLLLFFSLCLFMSMNPSIGLPTYFLPCYLFSIFCPWIHVFVPRVRVRVRVWLIHSSAQTIAKFIPFLTLSTTKWHRTLRYFHFDPEST